MTEPFMIPYGLWDAASGAWSHNDKLKKSKEEQHASNVKNGYSCDCGYIKPRCLCTAPAKTGVHATHCCVLHGCKYGDENCPVATGRIKQQYTCEECECEGIASLDDIKKIISGQAELCSHKNVRITFTSPVSWEPTFGTCNDCGKEVKATTTWEVNDGAE